MANERAKQAMDYFQSQGWTKEQAAGIVGNLMQESGSNLNPAATGGYLGRAEGIAQWLGPRKEDFINSVGVSPNRASFEQQLEFVQKELTTTEKNAGRALQNATSASEAASIFEAKYERAGGSAVGKRIANAEALMNGEAYNGPIASLKIGASSAVSKISGKISSALPPAFSGNTGIGNSVSLGMSGFVGAESFGPITNPLEQFSSFNCIFTLSCLTKKQYNYPDASDSYKNGNLGSIILRSGGGQPSNRVSTAYTTADNPAGKYEYYIDNVSFEALISFNPTTRGTNATTLEFEVFEPYSMGMFLQSLQIAAKELGWTNYIEAPFLLTLEFVGYDSSGNRVPADDTLDRHIPIKINSAEMEVKASGCKYSLTATAYNEVALNNFNNLLKEDMNISGSTVAELLQTGKNSLQFWLNSSLEQMAKSSVSESREKVVPDEIVIIFPKETDSASSPITGPTEDNTKLVKNVKSLVKNNEIQSKLTLTRGSSALLVQSKDTLNEIGQASLGLTINVGNTGTQHGSNEVQSEAAKPISRKSNSFNPKEGVFRFPQGTSIINAIEEVLLMSNYCKSAVEASDSRGMKKWFRIETQTFILDAQKENKGNAREPKLLVFRVVPYYVHEYRFSTPTSQPKGYEQLKKGVAKEYNYIYTGKNVDILNFNIKLDASFYSSVYADSNANNSSVYPQLNGASVEKTASPKSKTSSDISQEQGVPSPGKGLQETRYKPTGGGPNDTPQTLIAKNFQEAILNSDADMITVEMEILGDPYFIADSGMGNFNDRSKTFNVNNNGSMNYQSGEVDILVNFRTPVDINTSTGYMDFGPSTLVEGFSGLYQVIRVMNKFNSGKFIQTLDLVRRRNQTPTESANISSAQAALNASSATQDAVSNVVNQGKSVIDSATGGVIGVINNTKQTAEGAASKVLDSVGSKALAVNPSQPEKKSIDSTTGGSTDNQFDFDIKSFLPGSWW